MNQSELSLFEEILDLLEEHDYYCTDNERDRERLALMLTSKLKYRLEDEDQS